MSAADRIAQIDQIPARDLCVRAHELLTELLQLVNEETTLLRAGNYKQSEAVTARKASVAQDYVVVARAVQRNAERIKTEAPDLYQSIRKQHESFATQMAENLRVIATARNVTQTLLNDVAKSVAPKTRPNVYGANGAVGSAAAPAVNGFAVNRAL